MAVLPQHLPLQPGNWSPLNDFLTVSLNTDGTLKSVLAPSGDTTGVADLAAIQALHDALPATGGSITLGPGAFYINAGLSFTKPVSMTGAGGGLSGDASTTPPVALTTIYCTVDTVDAISTTSAGCLFRDFALVNTLAGTPTAGSGIKDTLVSNSSISRVTILGFYNNLDIGGVFSKVDNCWFYDAVNYYVYFHAPSASYNDHGDTGFTNNVIAGWNKTRVANALVRWESGGGMRLTGNKFNGGGEPGNASSGAGIYGLDIVITQGVATSSLVISGNSFSGTTANTLAHIRLTNSGSFSGTFTNVAISGNEFAIGQVGVLMSGGAASQNLHDATITGNVFNGQTVGGIQVANFGGLHIGPNHWGRSMTGPLITLASSADTGGNATFAPRVDKQSLGTLDGIDVILDSRSGSLAHAGFASTALLLSNGVDYDYVRNVILTANGAWVTQFVIKVPRASGGVIEVEVAGQNGVAGNGTGASRKGVYLKQLRSYDVSTADAVTLTTVGTDVANGAGGTFVAIQYVLTNNTITIQTQTTDVTQVWFAGVCRVRAHGKLDTFHIGA